VFAGRVVQPGEPYWLPDDVDLALAWQHEVAMTCGGCGHPLDETSEAANARAYIAESITCQACAVMEWRREAGQEENPSGQAGVRIYAVRKSDG
jgi:hypothetical protein